MTELRQWIKDVGFPIAVAMLLLGLLLRAIPEIDAKVDAMSTALTHHADTAYGRGTTMIRLLRLICRNGALDKPTRLECDRTDSADTE